MDKVFAALAVSVDGFITGRDPGPGHGLGDGGILFDWYGGGDVPSRVFSGFKLSEASRAVFDDVAARVGAVVAGRNTYDDSDGFGGSGSPHPTAPLIVVSHRPPPPESTDKQTFVTSLEAGIERASRARRQARRPHRHGASTTRNQAAPKCSNWRRIVASAASRTRRVLVLSGLGCGSGLRRVGEQPWARLARTVRRWEGSFDNPIFDSLAPRGPPRVLLCAADQPTGRIWLWRRRLVVMDSTSWIIATATGSYWGKSFGKDGVTFVRANAYQYDSRELAATQIARLAAAGDTRDFHVEAFYPNRRRY